MRVQSGWEVNKPKSSTEIGEGWKWSDEKRIWLGPHGDK
jgi:hypothetical protein